MNTITNKSITDTYLKANKLKRTAGRDDTLTALLPFLIMDAHYQMYNKDIKPMEVRFEMKKIKKEWLQCYNKFNQAFFRNFEESERDFIISKMDSYEEYIHNHIVILRCELYNLFRKHNIDESKHRVMATALICDAFAQAANVVWQHSYLDMFGRAESNAYLQRISRLAFLFANKIHNDGGKIDLNKSPKVVGAMNSLCHRLVSWIGKDAEDDRDKGNN